MRLLLGTLLFIQLPIPPIPSNMPVRNPTTVGSVFEQLGRCNVSLSAEQEYVQQLSARIKELEAQLKPKAEGK